MKLVCLVAFEPVMKRVAFMDFQESLCSLIPISKVTHKSNNERQWNVCVCVRMCVGARESYREQKQQASSTPPAIKAVEFRSRKANKRGKQACANWVKVFQLLQA